MSSQGTFMCLTSLREDETINVSSINYFSALIRSHYILSFCYALYVRDTLTIYCFQLVLNFDLFIIEIIYVNNKGFTYLFIYAVVMSKSSYPLTVGPDVSGS